MMKYNFIPALLILFVLSCCSTLKPESFSSSTPILDPVKFFGGHTSSAGVMEARSGKPSVRITTKTAGIYTHGILSIEQDLYPENGKQNHRSFNLKLVDAHHVEGTGSDIAGTARGELYGNYFTWRFRLKIAGKGLVQHVNMTQYMYLMPDGKTLIIRSVVRKFGMIVKQITEQFHKDD
ncbi:MAG: DUF3833 family protein [Ferruginibacter sp.]